MGRLEVQGVPRLTHCPAAGKQEEAEEQPPSLEAQKQDCYFRPLVLAEAGAAFGKTQGLHSTSPSQRCPRTGRGPGQSELPGSCLTVWHWTQDAGLEGEFARGWETAADHLTHHHLPAERLPAVLSRAIPVPQKHVYF